MLSRITLLLLVAALLAACSASPRERAEKRVREGDLVRLRVDAAVLYKNIFASATPSIISIKNNAWPESFRRFEPMHVNAYPDGFSLALEQDSGVESGLYVVPTGMEIVPTSKGRARFEQVADGVFWYSFQP